MKINCKECGELLEFNSSNFFHQEGAKGGLRKICKECSKKQRKKWYRENRAEKIYEYDSIEFKAIRSHFKLTHGQYGELLVITSHFVRLYEQGILKHMSEGVSDKYSELTEGLEEL